MNRVLMVTLKDDSSATTAVVEDAPSAMDSTMGLRIAAVFIILSAALLGGVPPLFVKVLRNQDSLPTFLIRAFSAGVILALALVHILPEAVEELVDVFGVDYPLGGTSVLVGLFIMVFIEHGAHIMYDMPHVHVHVPAGGGSDGARHNHSQGRGHGGHGHAQDRSHSHSHRGLNSAPGVVVHKERLLALGAREEWGVGGNVDCVTDADRQRDGKRVVAAEGSRSHAHACMASRGPSPLRELKEGLQYLQQGDRQLEQGQQQDEQQDEQKQPVALWKRPVAVFVATAAGVGRSGGGSFARLSAGAALTHQTNAAAVMTQSLPLAASSLPLLEHAIGIARYCKQGDERRRSDGCTATIAFKKAAVVNDESSTIASASNDESDAVVASTPVQRPTVEGVDGDGGADAATLSRVALLRGPSDHCHDCVSRASAPNWASAVEARSEANSSLRLRIVAYLFEFGCIFHSFIIGLSLGVNRTSISQVRALLIALSFHQALEGLSLASVINGGGFPIGKAAVMIATYSVTCPLGVAIGIALATSYNPDSTHGRAAQGCLNGVSGGMLLYISLVQLVAEDMGKYLLGPQPATSAGTGDNGGDGVAAATAEMHGSELPCSHSHGRGNGSGGDGGKIGCRIRAPSFLAFCLGAGSMCLLAVWA